MVSAVALPTNPLFTAFESLAAFARRQPRCRSGRSPVQFLQSWQRFGSGKHPPADVAVLAKQQDHRDTDPVGLRYLGMGNACGDFAADLFALGDAESHHRAPAISSGNGGSTPAASASRFFTMSLQRLRRRPMGLPGAVEGTAPGVSVCREEVADEFGKPAN